MVAVDGSCDTIGSKQDLIFDDPSMTAFRASSRKLRIAVLCIIVFLAVLTICFAALYIVEKSNNNNGIIAHKPVEHRKSDTTKANQVVIAARVISAMDLTVDPCQDFYHYACGGWLKNTPIPDSRSMVSTFSILSNQNSGYLKARMNDVISGNIASPAKSIRKAVDYYVACMDKKTIEKRGDTPLKSVIQDYGSWPVTDKNFSVKAWNWSDVFIKIHKNLSFAPLFNMYVGEDIRMSTENVIIFDQSGLLLSKDAYLQNSTYHEKIRNAYRSLTAKIVSYLGADQNQSKLMDEVFDFEVQLANISLSVLQRRNFKENYRSMTLKEFAEETSIPLSWLSSYLNAMFAETGYEIKGSQRIVTYATEYIKKAWRLFHDLRDELKAAYMMWIPVNSLAGTLLGDYRKAFNEYYEEISETTEESPRWETCMSSTSNAFGFAVGRLFVEEKFTQAAKESAEEMIHGVNEVFIENLADLTWMDKQTRAAARLKAQGILENIGYPKFIKNNTALDIFYEQLGVKQDEYFENILRRKSFYNLRNFRKLGHPVDKTEWGMIPSEVNAYYSPTENKIVFPAGILQPPFYDHRALRALNYGAIGMVVGHETTHGFDDQGREFNKEGNFMNWWTQTSEREFVNRAQCLATQYSKYSLYGVHLNGNQTLGENIADNGGIKQSFQAYKKYVASYGEEERLPGIDLSPEQLFFVGFAQIWCASYRESAAKQQVENGLHSITQFRVTGSLHNSDDFARVFQCKEGTPMNPKGKCSLW